MTDDEQRQEARDLIRFVGAPVEEVAEGLEVDVERAAALCAEASGRYRHQKYRQFQNDSA